MYTFLVLSNLENNKLHMKFKKHNHNFYKTQQIRFILSIVLFFVGFLIIMLIQVYYVLVFSIHSMKVYHTYDFISHYKVLNSLVLYKIKEKLRNIIHALFQAS